MSLIAKAKENLGSRGFARAFRHRDFSVYVAGSFASTLGMWVQRVAIGWLVWKLTGSWAWLGIVAMAGAVAGLVLLPLAGALADRYNKLNVLGLTLIVSALLSAALTVGAFLDVLNIEAILAFMILAGVANALGMPARMAIIPGLVPKEDLQAGVAVGSVMFNLSVLLGPALAGPIIDSFGVEYALLLNTVSYLINYVSLRMVRGLRHERRRESAGILSDIKEGLGYVRGHQGLTTVLLMAFMGALLVRPLQDLLPGLADQVFGGTAGALANLMVAYGIGGIVGSVLMASRRTNRGTTLYFYGGLSAMALLTGILSNSSSFVVVFSAIMGVGFAATLAANGAQVLIQGTAEGAMRARVISLYTLNFRTVPSLGALVIGGVAEWVGLSVAMGGACGLCLLVVVIYLPRLGGIRQQMERPALEEEVEPAGSGKPVASQG